MFYLLYFCDFVHICFVKNDEIKMFNKSLAICMGIVYVYICVCKVPFILNDLWPLLLTWINFNPGMDK